MRVPAFVCLCLLARLLKNAWMGLDEILLVDIAHERTDKLLSPIRIIVWIQEPDFFNFSGISQQVMDGFRLNFMGR